MSMPYDIQPPAGVYQQVSSEGSHDSNGSIGPVIVVLAVIAILGVVAGMVGRLCAGRRGDGEYDLEGWIERRCTTCIDGRVESVTAAAIPVAKPAESAEPPKPAENTEAKPAEGGEGGGSGGG